MRLTAIFLIFGFFVGSSVKGEIQIKFDVKEPLRVSVTIDGNTHQEDPIALVVNKGDVLTFFVTTQIKDLKFKIIKVPNQKEATFEMGKFKNGKSISTDTTLKLNGLDLNTAFTALMIVGKDEVTKEFTVNVSDDRNVGKRGLKLYSPGIAILDAFALADTINTSQSSWLAILQYYFKRAKESQSSDLQPLIDSNAFLHKSLKPYDHFRKDSKEEKDAYAQGIIPTGYNALSPSTLGGLDVTNLADGMAKFLVTRTKQELASAFFDRFKEVIADSDYMDLQTLFPSTYNTLIAIGDEIYNYDAYMQSLRESFETDFNQFTAHFPSIVNNHKIFFNKHRDLVALLNSGCYVAEAMNNHVHPGDMLANYPTEYLDNLNTNWKGAIQTLQLLSGSLRDSSKSDSASYWVSPAKIKMLVDDTTTFKLYLGLVYQQAKNDSIHFAHTYLYEILDLVAPPHFNEYYANYKSYFTNLAATTDKLTSLLSVSKKPQNDSLAIERYYSFVNASIDFLQSAGDVDKLALSSHFKPMLKDSAFFRQAKNNLKEFIDVTRAAVQIVYDIKKRNYTAALVNCVTIYRLTVSQHLVQDKLEYEARQSADDSAKKQFIRSRQDTDVVRISLRMTSRKDTLDNIDADLHSADYILRYGTFMATIVQAKNSDDVASAIEAFAMPAGSSRIKRQCAFDIALNAYLGLFYGVDRIEGFDKPYVFLHANYNSWGVSAPIGIAASTSVDGWSFSLFASVIDLGAVAAFRFNDDTTKQIPTIQLKDIVSPGVFLSIGIPSTPISINYGVQIGPNLHTVNSDKNDYSSAAYYRYSFSICVDIPLLDFYNKSRN